MPYEGIYTKWLYIIGYNIVVYVLPVINIFMIILFVAKKTNIIKHDRLIFLTKKRLIIVIVISLLIAYIVPNWNPRAQSLFYFNESEIEFDKGNSEEACKYLKISIYLENAINWDDNGKTKKRICSDKKLIKSCGVDMNCQGFMDEEEK